MSGIIDPGSVVPSKPITPLQGPTEGSPKMPEGAKEFHGPEGGGKKMEESAATEKPPSLMELAGQMGRSKEITQESVQNQLSQLQDTLAGAKDQLQKPGVALRPDQEKAFDKLVDKMNGSMSQIAKHSDSEFVPKKQAAGQKMVDFLTDWIDGSQKTMGKALSSVSKMENPGPADLMNLQYSVQKASQRAELFSSIIGASVSGIKTIMSTQLG